MIAQDDDRLFRKMTLYLSPRMVCMPTYGLFRYLEEKKPPDRI